MEPLMSEGSPLTMQCIHLVRIYGVGYGIGYGGMDM